MLRCEHGTRCGSVRTPAKVNLFLEVIGKRPDGYHDLVTLMAPIDWYDTIRFREHGPSRSDPHRSDRLAVRGSDLTAGDDNLVLRAVRALRSYREFPTLEIELEKRLPFGAGLGGGSSNAAGTLRWITDHYELAVPEKELRAIATDLGSDVPFFLGEGAAICRGRGERIEPIREPLFGGAQPHFVLLLPELSCATAVVFGALTFPLTSPDAPIPFDSRAFTRKYEDGRGEETERRSRPPFFNRLEATAIESYPDLRPIADWLDGHDSIAWLLTGSGSTFFAVFSEPESAESFADRARCELGLATRVCRLAT